MPDLHELWAETNRLLSQALNEVRLTFDQQTLDVVQHYLEHNELELAFRSIQDAATENGVELSATAVSKLKRAAYLMKIDY